ncbi:hypothetical protein TrLO_g2378 [Triparma laevis f. longispina]|uniref:C2 domain-containing protein n=1 Tax=Triparma laevis f. longispina TaxID=1714387 RepID=A0A9W7ANN5_9STRA|nr:hypothetical protein TrLO_g2378 [Triparma laevis f. longispina]
MDTPRSPLPALLPSLLQKHSWDSVISRCSFYPDEASLPTHPNHSYPLHAAITSLAPSTVISALITAYPAACSERNSFGQLPLHLACDFDSAHEILSTAEKSAKSEDNPINKLPETALKWSPSRRQSGVKGQMGLLNTDFEKVERNRVEVVELLLSAFPTASRLADDNKRLPLHVAAWLGAPPQVIKMLLEKNPSTATRYTKDGNLAIHLAARKTKVSKESKTSTSKEKDDSKKPDKNKTSPSAKSKSKTSSPPSKGKRPSTPSKSSPASSPTRLRIMKCFRDAETFTKKAWPDPSPEDEDEESDSDSELTDEQKEEKRLLKEEDSKAAYAIAKEITRCEARIKNIFLEQDKKQRVRAQVLAEKREKERKEIEIELEKERAAAAAMKDVEGLTSREEGVQPNSDPIVKLLATSLSRHGRKKMNFLLKTQVIEKNCKHPVWDEYFEMTVGEEFQGTPLTLQVFDFDDRDGDDPCGCVVLNLEELPCVEGEARCGDGEGEGRWETLIPNPDESFKSAKGVTGALRYQASWDPAKNLLKLHVMEAMNLAPKDFTKVVKKKEKRVSEPPKPKKKKEENLDPGLEVLDLLLRYNCDGVEERDGTGMLPKQVVKATGAKTLLDPNNIKKNLARWSKRENKTGDIFGEKVLVMDMSEEVMMQVMINEEERGLVFEDHKILLTKEKGYDEEFGGYMDSERSVLDHV